ncbi:MAG: hypothetical protein ACLVKO_11865 [Dysgonomonas sp.]
MKNCILILFALACVFSSCQEKKKVDTGTIKEKEYTSDEIGWTIEIPDGWRVTNIDQRNALNEKGKGAIQDAIGVEIDASELKNLIGFQKNRFNIFISTIEPFVEEYLGEWLENNKTVNEIVIETFRQNGINPTVLDSKVENVGGIDFQVNQTIIELPDNNKLTQIMYSALINNYDFGATISYTNPKYGEEMLNAFRRSKFKK